MTDEELRMTFTEHLGELRTRLIRACAALGVSVILCFVVSDYIMMELARPLAPLVDNGAIVAPAPASPTAPAGETTTPPDAATATPPVPVPAPAPTPAATTANGVDNRPIEWTILSPMEPFVAKLTIAGYAGVVLALPFILWQICAFIFPGLKTSEKNVLKILIFGCSGLALFGVCVAYFFVFPMILPYLMQYALPKVKLQLRLSETLDVIIKGLMGFAVAFQFPMAVLILVYMDLLSPAALKQYRKLAIVAMAFVAAILTPPDVFSMSIMLVPMLILYEGSILLSYLVVRHKKQQAETNA